ncbi:MAG: diadenylate cyclase CdaA [Pontiellaceae bacterium]
MELLKSIVMPDGQGWVEIIILSLLIYFIFKFFKGTRGSSIFSGLIVFFIGLYALTSIINLDVLNWLLSKLTLYLSLAIIIIFQPEIRRALARLGRQPWQKKGSASQKNLANPLIQAVSLLSDKKTGALIAIEREIGTRSIQDTGTVINAAVTPEIITSIFFPRSPLHDGGVIISGTQIRSASCIFPLSQKDQSNKSLGTRHRAAIGITEETDAVVIVVSEQTGGVSLAYNGKIKRGLSKEKFQRMLFTMLNRERTGLIHFRKKIEEAEAVSNEEAKEEEKDAN